MLNPECKIMRIAASRGLPRKDRHIRGFSLTEVLVAVFVLGLGVIGAAAMQLSALRTTQQSRFQTNATQLASEMADKMRANASQMKLSDDMNPFLSVSYASLTDAAPTAPGKQCYAATCDSGELAGFDIYDFQKRVKATLPGGRAMICRDAQPWDVAANAFRWDCNAESGKGSVVIKLGWQERRPDGSLLKDANQQVHPGLVLTVSPYMQ